MDSPMNDLARASFMGLPPELRNAIYEQVAASTTLTFTPSKRGKRPQTVAMLQVSKQIYNEYRPILLAGAKLIFRVTKFDFSFLVKTINTSPRQDLEAFAANRRLHIQLVISGSPQRSDLESISRWLVYRSGLSASPATSSESAQQARIPHSLNFRYDAAVKPSGISYPTGNFAGSSPGADPANLKIGLISALGRQLTGFDASVDPERQHMVRGLVRCKDVLTRQKRPPEMRSDGADAAAVGGWVL